MWLARETYACSGLYDRAQSELWNICMVCMTDLCLNFNLIHYIQLVKTGQTFFMRHDNSMLDSRIGKRCIVQNSVLNEDLGQVCVWLA